MTGAEGGTKVPLTELPVASTSLTSEPILEYPVGTHLRLTLFYKEDGLRYSSVLRFTGLRAFRHRAEGVCTAWHVKDAYDTLVEISDSPWREELETLMYERGHNPGELHHFMIYIDSAGCYEAVARSWELLAPAPAD
jgi:hypothetical protein